MTTYCCKSPFCNCEGSESDFSCGCKGACSNSCKKEKPHSCKCCCCCCGHHDHHGCGCNETVCYPVAVESFGCKCGCVTRC